MRSHLNPPRDYLARKRREYLRNTIIFNGAMITLLALMVYWEKIASYVRH